MRLQHGDRVFYQERGANGKFGRAHRYDTGVVIQGRQDALVVIWGDEEGNCDDITPTGQRKHWDGHVVRYGKRMTPEESDAFASEWLRQIRSDVEG